MRGVGLGGALWRPRPHARRPIHSGPMDGSPPRTDADPLLLLCCSFPPFGHASVPPLCPPTDWLFTVPRLPPPYLVPRPQRHRRDVVEELEAEASHQKAVPKKDPLEAYCEDSPEADECRTYDN